MQHACVTNTQQKTSADSPLSPNKTSTSRFAVKLMAGDVWWLHYLPLCFSFQQRHTHMYIFLLSLHKICFFRSSCNFLFKINQRGHQTWMLHISMNLLQWSINKIQTLYIVQHNSWSFSSRQTVDFSNWILIQSTSVHPVGYPVAYRNFLPCIFFPWCAVPFTLGSWPREGATDPERGALTQGGAPLAALHCLL